MSFRTTLAVAGALLVASQAEAQVVAAVPGAPSVSTPATTVPIGATPPPAATLAAVKLVEGTEMLIRIEDTLSSKTSHEGDRFTISLDDDVTLADGTVLKAGYRGVGEVVEARSNGAMGKTGKINLRLNYLKVGDQRIRLRGQKSAQGDHRTGTQVVTVVLVGVFAGFVKGKNTTIPKGTMVNAYVDQDILLDRPFPPPPVS